MAKIRIRVYELAKDLDMTSKALLSKIKELKIEVKSHMSPLEDSAVKAIKQSLFGKKKKTDADFRSSVIRRRRFRSEKSESAKPIENISSSNDNIAVDLPDQQQHKNKNEQKKEEQKEKTKSVQATENKEKLAVSTPKSKKQSRKSGFKKSEPAKIIKLPIVNEAESVKTASEDEKQVDQIASSKSDVKLELSSTPDEASEKLMKPVKKLDKSKADNDNSQHDALKSKNSALYDSEKEKDAATNKTKMIPDQKKLSSDSKLEQKKRFKSLNKKKKRKGTTPAKIVSVADPKVLENLQKTRLSGDYKSTGEKVIQGENKETIVDIPNEIVSSNSKKDKSRDDTEGVEKKRKWKKKAIVERATLYDENKGPSRSRKQKKEHTGKREGFRKPQITTPKAIKRRIKIDEAIELAELAKRMGIKANEMITKLMTMGVMATVNQTIDFKTACLVASEFGFEVEKAIFEEEMLLNDSAVEDNEEDLIERAPVVTIMGHVDHGKTSLLDVIRKSKITSGEAGGITQHIGAYNVKTPNGGRVTFLDTPGHAAFTAMRSRGAQVTDIVILVVAADDGVMPQTVEAINHSKAASVPVVVALNKIDKLGADPDRVMRELSEHDLLPEEWGGDVIFCKVSAKSGQGIDNLLEMILLQSEVLELKANPNKKASGYVVESRLDTGRGAVATVLVKQGTLRDGDAIVCGLHSGRIRAMIDEYGKRIDNALPSTPVEIVGLTGVPDAGDEFIVVASDKDAKQIAQHRMQKQRARELAKKSRASLEKMFENLGSAEAKKLKLIVKADVQGSIEVLNDSLKELAKEEVDVKIIHSGTGTINESDVALASVSDAIIIGFNVRPMPHIRKLAKDENVDMRFYGIIYDVINDIKTALEGMIPPTFHEIIIGRAEVIELFVVPKIGTIAGCSISEGKVTRSKKIRLLRDGIIKCDTKLSSLRRYKDDVKEVEQGYECGIGLEKFNDIKVGDVIECYEIEERKYKESK